MAESGKIAGYFSTLDLTLLTNKNILLTQSCAETVTLHFIFDNLIAVLFVTSLHQLLRPKPA